MIIAIGVIKWRLGDRSRCTDSLNGFISDLETNI